jgi:hypothetical protein
VPFAKGIPEQLMEFIRGVLRQDLRACYPRDIIDQVCWAARFDDKDPFVDLGSLDQAIKAYFVRGPGNSLASAS